MKTSIVFDSEATINRKVRKQMFKLRKKVFCDTLNWDIPHCKGQEADVYDLLDCFYMNMVEKNSKNVMGSVRLIPLSRDNLLATVFKNTIDEAKLKAMCEKGNVWEGTRLCVDENINETKNSRKSMAQLLISLFQTCRTAGIEKLVCNCDKSMMRLYRLLGLEFELLGSTDEFNHDVVYCISFEVSRHNHHVLLKLAQKFKIEWPKVKGNGLCLAHEITNPKPKIHRPLDIGTPDDLFYIPKLDRTYGNHALSA